MNVRHLPSSDGWARGQPSHCKAPGTCIRPQTQHWASVSNPHVTALSPHLPIAPRPSPQASVSPEAMRAPAAATCGVPGTPTQLSASLCPCRARAGAPRGCPDRVSQQSRVLIKPTSERQKHNKLQGLSSTTLPSNYLERMLQIQSHFRKFPKQQPLLTLLGLRA